MPPNMVSAATKVDAIQKKVLLSSQRLITLEYMTKEKRTTTAKIRSALRRLWLYSPERKDALLAAKVDRGQYLCNGCNGIFRAKEVQVDHVIPIGKFENWDLFIDALFCPSAYLNILCKDCHNKKTEKERATNFKRK